MASKVVYKATKRRDLNDYPLFRCTKCRELMPAYKIDAHTVDTHHATMVLIKG